MCLFPLLVFSSFRRSVFDQRKKYFNHLSLCIISIPMVMVVLNFFLSFWLNFEGELETTLGELEENNRQLATLKAERDSTKGATFPVLNFLNNKPVDRARDKQKDLQDMESTLKELTVLCWLSLFG